MKIELSKNQLVNIGVDKDRIKTVSQTSPNSNDKNVKRHSLKLALELLDRLDAILIGCGEREAAKDHLSFLQGNITSRLQDLNAELKAEDEFYRKHGME